MRRERRQNIRVEWHSPGKIYDCDGDLLGRCVIKDFSNGGAKVTGIAVGRIPDRFMLRIARGAVGMRKCHVLWRSATTVGVEFADGLPHANRRSSARLQADASRHVHA
ncbi:MAG: PilZ domain-containing protein [Hyphomicrobiales bacterium]|nr:PilZ domain-containing protein [Hyphomicrobiales bacterium]